MDRTVKYTDIWYVFFDLHSKLNVKQIYEITHIEIIVCRKGFSNPDTLSSGQVLLRSDFFQCY